VCTCTKFALQKIWDFFLRQGKLCACTACQLLAELLALKRFNSAEWPQFLSRRFNTIGQSDRLT
jgi:hypothetical protein